MSFDPNIFDIISELHNVATYLNTHGCPGYYIEFIPIFRLIGIGNYETAILKLSIFNNRLALVTSSQHYIFYCRAVEKLKNIVKI